MLTGIHACVFDADGTLFDYAAGCANALGDKAGPLAALSRDKQLQYSWLRALQGRNTPFWQVTGEALDHALETLGLPQDGPLRDRLMNVYRTLGAFPEIPGVLRELRELGFAIAVLSSGSPEMLVSAVDGTGLANAIDTVVSVDTVSSFKPDLRIYQLAVDRLGVAAEAIASQSSNAWDAHAAAAFGMRVVWYKRYGQRRERLPGTPDQEIRTLAELPAPLVS